jgi:hypothetical protein
MQKIHGRRLGTAMLATLLAAALAGPARAASAQHEHAHDTAAPHKLSLNQGHKWATDEALRNGMNRIKGLVEPQLGAAHAGKLDAAKYRELASQVEAEVGGIVANCKLEPKADAALHLVIADIGEGVEAMSGKAAKQKPAQGLNRVALAVNDYGKHFDHPGFKPIHPGH